MDLALLPQSWKCLIILDIFLYAIVFILLFTRTKGPIPKPWNKTRAHDPSSTKLYCYHFAFFCIFLASAKSRFLHQTAR